MKLKKELLERVQAELLSIQVDWLNSIGMTHQENMVAFGEQYQDLQWLAKNPVRFRGYFHGALESDDFLSILKTAWKIKSIARLNKRKSPNEN